MTDIIYLKTKARDHIYNQFPPLKSGELPHLYEIQPIEYGKQSIEEYDVIYWHRLLKSIYQEPLEIEYQLYDKNQANKICETTILRRLEEKSEWEILNTSKENILKIKSGEIELLPVNWKYFIKLPSRGIIEIGTKDQHTDLYFAHVVSGQVIDIYAKEAEKFISMLLNEAKKAGHQLFNPREELKKRDSLKLYSLFNVYRANYVRAKFMLDEALTQEEYLLDEFLKYDLRTNDRYDEGKRDHFDRFMLARGMYFSSAIIYLFMSLEGFINIIFHSFLNKNLKGAEMNIEQRIDIELKLKLMPALCDGFSQEFADSTTEIYSKFHKLKDYRNRIFHSKVEDSLKNIGVYEDGFIYSCDLVKYKDQFLPSQNIFLSANDVIEVKRIVDGVIDLILNSMTAETRMLTDKYILKTTQIPFFILSDGSLSLGTSDREKNKNNHT